MIYDIYYSSQALDDLTDIYTYIAFQLFEPQTAKKLCGDIIDAVSKLDTFPSRNALYENEPWKSKGLRKLHVKNYIVFYTVNDEKRIVNIIRIMYGGRDFDKQLTDNQNKI